MELVWRLLQISRISGRDLGIRVRGGVEVMVFCVVSCRACVRNRRLELGCQVFWYGLIECIIFVIVLLVFVCRFCSRFRNGGDIFSLKLQNVYIQNHSNMHDASNTQRIKSLTCENFPPSQPRRPNQHQINAKIAINC